MKHVRIVWLGIILSFFLLFSTKFVAGQSLSSPSASFSEQTSYPVFTGKDFIYYFCGANGHLSGTLKATSAGSLVTFTWEKFKEIISNYVRLPQPPQMEQLKTPGWNPYA